MKRQITTFLLVSWMLATSIAQGMGASSSTDIASRLGNGIMAVEGRGTMSATGPHNISGLSVEFTSMTDSAFRMTVGGPFGITAAKMYATKDTFVLINYLMRDVACGNPVTAVMTVMVPITMTVSEYTMIMQGRLFGDPNRFVSTATDDQNTVLLKSKLDSVIEYVLVDTLQHSILQYQRKRESGYMELNVTFGDIRSINGFFVPFGIDIWADDKKQSMSIRLTDVVVNGVVDLEQIKIPSSFTCTIYR